MKLILSQSFSIKNKSQEFGVYNNEQKKSTRAWKFLQGHYIWQMGKLRSKNNWAL